MERLIPFLLVMLPLAPLHAQDADRALRKGNAEYRAGRMQAAEQAYSLAEQDERGMFNLGNALFRQDSIADAARSYENAASMAKTPEAQARAYHNLGNTWMKQRNYAEAVNAYKEALKRTPSDWDTRYNLAYAQKMLAREQQQQQQQNGDKNKDQNKDQDGQQNKDQDKEQDKDGQQKQDGQQDQQPPKQDQGDKGKGQEQRIDPQDAKRMLDAAQQQEKDVQEKVRQLMLPKPKQPAEKDW